MASLGGISFLPTLQSFEDLPWFAEMRAHGQELKPLLCGAIGGPLAVLSLTPQRNAMTLSAKQPTLSFFGLYRQVFTNGILSGFRGGGRPTVMAVPQFTAIGPVYLAMEKATGSPFLSMWVAAFGESLLSYNAQTRNAQIQYNAAITSGLMGGAGGVQAGAAPASAPTPLALTPSHQLIGPGFVAHISRNAFAMVGIRCLSPYSRPLVEAAPGSRYLNEGCKDVAADFASSTVAAIVSAPFNQAFSWAVCTPELTSMSYPQRASACLRFLYDNYRQQGARLVMRDICVRISYTGCLFTIYRYVERKIAA